MQGPSSKVLRLVALSLMLFALLAGQVSTGSAQNAAKPKPAAKSKAAAPAPAAAAPTFSRLAVLQVKPDMTEEIQTIVKGETIPALQKAGIKEFRAWGSAVTGEYYQLALLSPVENFADFDGPNPYVKALGEEGARAYSLKVRKTVISRHDYILQERPDLSVQAKTQEDPKVAVVSWVRIAPGRTIEFESLVKTEVLPLIAKANLKGYYVSQVTLGGNANEYIVAALYENFADIGKGDPFVRVLGQEGANKFRQKLAGIVVNVERATYRYIPDMSFPQAMKAENK